MDEYATLTKVEYSDRDFASAGVGTVVLVLTFFSIPPAMEVHCAALMVDGTALAMVDRKRVDVIVH